jgi:hypothetical protein
MHRPVFRHIMYCPLHESFSMNLASLSAIIKTLDIKIGPYVLDLKIKLADSAMDPTSVLKNKSSLRTFTN